MPPPLPQEKKIKMKLTNSNTNRANSVNIKPVLVCLFLFLPVEIFCPVVLEKINRSHRPMTRPDKTDIRQNAEIYTAKEVLINIHFIERRSL